MKKEVAEEPMKTAPTKNRSRKIRLPRNSASYAELSDFFDHHDGVDLVDQGITEIDPHREDLKRMRRESGEDVGD